MKEGEGWVISTHPLRQGFSTLALPTVWAGKFFNVRGYICFLSQLLKITLSSVSPETTEMDSPFTVLKPRSLKSVLLGQYQNVSRAPFPLEAQGGNPFLPVPASGSQHPLACGHITPIFKVCIFKSFSVFCLLCQTFHRLFFFF